MLKLCCSEIYIQYLIDTKCTGYAWGWRNWIWMSWYSGEELRSLELRSALDFSSGSVTQNIWTHRYQPRVWTYNFALDLELSIQNRRSHFASFVKNTEREKTIFPRWIISPADKGVGTIRSGTGKMAPCSEENVLRATPPKQIYYYRRSLPESRSSLWITLVSSHHLWRQTATAEGNKTPLEQIALWF